jgi:TRAP-type C4-dicarboxylate transport system substrate-binding protein
MGGGKAALNIVRDGLVDSAFINPGYMPSNLPMGAVLGSMFAPDTMATAGAENEMELFNCPACVAELKKNHVKPLAYYATATYSLMCAKPIKTTDDIKGLKVRTSGGYNFLALKLGAVPVNLTSGEIYEGLQRGQLDCVLGAPGWLQSYNLADLVKSIVDMPMGVYHGIPFFNMKQSVWNDLKPAERQIIIKNLPKLVADLSEIYSPENENARKIAREKNIAFVKPDEKMITAFKEYTEEENKRILEKAKKDGVKGADKMVLRLKESIAKWEKIIADIKGDPAKFEAALEKDVFSKLKP